MTWVRIDDEMPEHPKLLAAGPLAFALDVAAICYSSRMRTDGRVPRAKVRLLLDLSDIRVGRAKVDALELAEKLVACGRWHRDGDDYRIHDFDQYNPTRAEADARTSALTEIRRAAGRRGGLRSAEARRHAGEANADPVASKTEANSKQASSKAEANGEAKAKQTGSKSEAPIPIPNSHTHSPPNPPQADESGEVVEPPASKTLVRPIGSPAPVASKGEPSSPEARRLLEAIRSHEAIRAAAMPEVATALEGRRMMRGTPVEVLVEAIGECAREAAMQAASGAPWDVTRIASQLGRYCDTAAKAWTSRPRDDRQRPRGDRPAGLPPVQPMAKPGQYDWRTQADAKRAEKLAKYMNDELPPEAAAAFGGGT